MVMSFPLIVKFANGTYGSKSEYVVEDGEARKPVNLFDSTRVCGNTRNATAAGFSVTGLKTDVGEMEIKLFVISMFTAV